MTNVDYYAVMGNPIAHSKSPFIHATFAQQTQQAIHYDAMLVEKEQQAFSKAVNAFKAQQGKGLNITVPFKEYAWQISTRRSERAEKAGAVNTIWFDEQGDIVGDNTDGVGIVRDITQNQQHVLTGKRILILGAGGAVRGVLGPILAEYPEQCVITNRTVSKAEALAELFTLQGNVYASSYQDLKQPFDVIINGTSASLQGNLPPLPNHILAEQGWCYDMMYAATPTPFMQWALANQATAIDGLGMLVEQAAEAFYLWRGVKPNTLPVIQQLRQKLLMETT